MVELEEEIHTLRKTVQPLGVGEKEEVFAELLSLIEDGEAAVVRGSEHPVHSHIFEHQTFIACIRDTDVYRLEQACLPAMIAAHTQEPADVTSLVIGRGRSLAMDVKAGPPLLIAVPTSAGETSRSPSSLHRRHSQDNPPSAAARKREVRAWG
jgi:hypothetical protein